MLRLAQRHAGWEFESNVGKFGKCDSRKVRRLSDEQQQKVMAFVEGLEPEPRDQKPSAFRSLVSPTAATEGPMQKESVSREEVIELAKKMPSEKLARWYELGLLIESRSSAALDNAQLMEEIAAWEAASDEDWAGVESRLIEVS